MYLLGTEGLQPTTNSIASKLTITLATRPDLFITHLLP